MIDERSHLAWALCGRALRSLGSIFFLVSLVVCGINGHAQGLIIFNNRISPQLVAPVYDVEPANPRLGKQGNTPAGIPSGTQEYNGAPLSGEQYTAQLFGGPATATETELVALSPSTAFRTGDAAGFVVAPPTALTVPNVPEGDSAKIVMRVWRNTGGIDSWEQALLHPEVPRGESLAFISPPLGGILLAPPNMVGFESFNLTSSELRFLSGGCQTNGTFEVEYSGDAGSTYILEASSDLTNWFPLSTNLVIPGNPAVFQDSTAGATPRRFYRILAP